MLELSFGKRAKQERGQIGNFASGDVQQKRFKMVATRKERK
jgi:hypothetical protein